MSTVQEIAQEFLMNTRKSIENRKSLLRKSLSKFKEISQSEVEGIVSGIEDDSFLNAQLKLDTVYKRTKYIKENMTYVRPEEIVLNKTEVDQGKKKECLHYVPMDKSLQALLEDPSFNQMMAMTRHRNEEGKLGKG